MKCLNVKTHKEQVLDSWKLASDPQRFCKEILCICAGDQIQGFTHANQTLPLSLSYNYSMGQGATINEATLQTSLEIYCQSLTRHYILLKSYSIFKVLVISPFKINGNHVVGILKCKGSSGIIPFLINPSSLFGTAITELDRVINEQMLI